MKWILRFQTATAVQPDQAFATQSSFQLLQPRTMKAFEKDLIKSSETCDLPAMVKEASTKVNLETDSDESNVESLDNET